MISQTWCRPEDFATLFSYFWHKDFPVAPTAWGAHRADWTAHIGSVVKSIVDSMGLYTRYEYGGKTDAFIRDATYVDVAALEWEWDGVLGEQNELQKLRDRSHAVTKSPLRFCVLCTYAHTENIGKALSRVREKWQGATCPLLLILIDFVDSSAPACGREFKQIGFYLFDGETSQNLRSAPALPWRVEGTRWFQPEPL